MPKTAKEKQAEMQAVINKLADWAIAPTYTNNGRCDCWNNGARTAQAIVMKIIREYEKKQWD